MENKGEIWVIAEQDEGELAEISIELVSKGRELADRLNTSLGSVALGYNIKHVPEELFKYGCDVVYLADHPNLEYYTVLPYTKVIYNLAKKQRPGIILFGATTTGRDLAPRLASILPAGLTADCTDLQIGDYNDTRSKRILKDTLFQIRPAFGGNVIATIVNTWNPPKMATVREGVMKISAPDSNRNGKLISINPKFSEKDLITKVIKRTKSEKRVNLKNARIIVSGGFGVGGRDNFRLIYELAHTLGGEVAGSRAAVDAGFIEIERQVGQTGTTVRPKLYIACGISGAVQHRAGMAESHKIIAINKDPDAPIFKIAHYGIAGDLNQVIPMMIKAYKEKGLTSFEKEVSKKT